MYFQIDNTPERIRRARRREQSASDESPKEGCPRLVLAPFCRPPQIVFDNVLIGSTIERNLEVYNPTKQVQQITFGETLSGIVIQLPNQWLELEPEACYTVTLAWTPIQPTAMRETLHVTNQNRGRFDVIIVLKSQMNIKGKVVQPKSFKISPGKIKKKAVKKSPIALYKKKSEFIYSTTQVKKNYIVETSHLKVSQLSNKENMSVNDISMVSRTGKCPFESNIDINFNTSEIFPKLSRPEGLQQTFEKSPSVINNYLNVQHNVLKPYNKQASDSVTDLFDNLTFTPLKFVPSKTEKLEKGPKIIFSMNSESDFDDSLDMKYGNKKNETASVAGVTLPSPKKRLTMTHHTQFDYQYRVETPVIIDKRHPNTSSPKEFNSPNFSINTEFSRISDLSFHPQRFSTEQKRLPNLNHDTHDHLDDPYKVSSDTYTKDSPNTPIELDFDRMCDMKPPHFFMKNQQNMCRQALFKEYHFQKENCDQKPALNSLEHNIWKNDLRMNARSPPRSITPPLQSITEESVQFSDTYTTFDKSNIHKKTFTIDQTFDKTSDRFTTTHPNRQSWSKTAVRAQPDLWSIPITHIKKSVKTRQSKSKFVIGGEISNATFDTKINRIENMSANQIGNIYSQSSTIDPFISSTYFYDTEAVAKFETEFKRWLNCVLTPPADLDSNVEQKIDVGKAWIENRNKEVPIAPTREQVSSAYHNSYRLERVRRSARILFLNPEIVHVFQKLTLQIEKKIISIRTDRNLHLDVGLQKIIMELLLSYNPLWLRIGLETIYGLVLPLKSNSDIEGLTIFIIQRLFKNPFLKNKNSQSKAPNMLLPAYMEAIKKFTLKKFFMLVYFLDQAKQRKLISHDPCLFCRNAICKESREIIIRFTREVIAGIGDITKHLRPLGYVVSHKQTYLDEYKYAVHNIAVDIRDGVRLTKIMEIILMKEGLLSQLRTPPISRLQKIHNVQVALNALKEANFVIHGDISAADIADGHREKTLSLLWQIIHVFRAPLFEKAANVLQAWWRKKYEVITKEKREAENLIRQRNNAASVIQYWWRRIQYNRFVEWKMQQITTATIVVQKYCRRWLCRTRLLKYKRSALKIEEWYRSVIMMRKERSDFINLKKSAIILQRRYKAQMMMRKYSGEYAKLRQAILIIQHRYKAQRKMRIQRTNYLKLKSSCITIQSNFRAFVVRRRQRREFLQKKYAIKKIQSWYRSCKTSKKIRQKFQELKLACFTIQRVYKAYVIGRKQRQEYLRIRTATVTIQQYYRSYMVMKMARDHYVTLRAGTVIIQRYYRSYLKTKEQRKAYLEIKNAALLIGGYYKCYRETLMIRKRYCQLRETSIYIQRRYRSICAMREERQKFLNLISSTTFIQKKYRALMSMKIAKQSYLQLRQATITIQTRFRALRAMKQTRSYYLNQLKACRYIQAYYRSYVAGTRQRAQYLQWKTAAIILQRRFRALIAMKIQRNLYLSTRSAAIIIQRAYRSYCCKKNMLKEKETYTKMINSCTTIQRAFRAYMCGKRQKQEFNKIKTAVILIQTRYRLLRETRTIYDYYQKLRKTVVFVQRRYRAHKILQAIKLNEAAKKIQIWYRAGKQGNDCRREYLKLRNTVILIQSLVKMRIAHRRYISIKTSTIFIQNYYRNYKLKTVQRQTYLQTRYAIIKSQSYVRRFLVRKHYCKLRSAVIVIQAAYRLKKARVIQQERERTAAVCLQKYVRRYIARSRYLRYIQKVVYIQKKWRGKLLTRLIRCQFKQKRTIIIKLQCIVRGYLVRKHVQRNREHIQRVKEERRLNWAASKIQAYYRGHIVRVNMAYDSRVAELRHRWRNGGLDSVQETMRERHEEAMDVLFNIRHIKTLIKVFKSLELLTEVFPMMYKDNVSEVVQHVYVYMLGTNRSISNVQLLKYAAAVLVNLTRYRVTGPKVYLRNCIHPLLKFMWRYCKTEITLFCMMATYLWLFSKYENVKNELIEVLNLPENHKILVAIKTNIYRAKRMTENSLKSKLNTPNSRFSLTANRSISLPNLEPDYGIVKVDAPRYFVSAEQAINCLFQTYNL